MIRVEVYDPFADQAALYALGALTQPETRAFEAHVAVCVACASDLRGFAHVVDALASTTPEMAPTPEVRRALLSRIHTRHTDGRQVPRRPGELN